MDASFPSSIHDDVLAAVRLDLGEGSRDRNPRDPAFRGRILTAYEHRCAICSYDIRIGNNTLGLEAAHIKWHQAGGPDRESNGLALCATHHKLFDRGAFTLSKSRNVVVSEHASGSEMFRQQLMAHHGQPAASPVRSSFQPAEEYVAWHRSEVFRVPARE
jgi:putative restriction endonuclease